MAKVLILFAHPALEKSRVHARLIDQVQGINDITFNDLYETYPDFDIDVKKEQHLLLIHDVIIWQHPFYWYSSPAIIKQWQDLVLEHGWAYGSGGNMLRGKKIFNVITSGAPISSYAKTGRNRFTIADFLAPFDQTAVLCNMTYLPPFVVPNTHRLSTTEIADYAAQYRQLLLDLSSNRITFNNWQAITYLNNLYPIPEKA